MSQRTWFISDLHLDAKRPQMVQAFMQFLGQVNEQADALYILGDLFEYWIGDDIVDSPAGQIVKPLLGGLKQLSDNGTELYFTHGNRDFLVGERFAEMTGCTLLPEKQVIDLDGTPTLLMHGDTLCTDDVEYQELRKIFYDTERREQFLALSFDDRVAEANRIRQISQEKMQYKSEEIMDVNQQAVEAVMTEAGVTQLIHGHTHRLAIHEFDLNDQAAKRIVLGDWYEQVSCLKVSDGQLYLS
ncbi:UDP-2,3-diacylglucosamine diphosphatase [Leucothrix pacifica]|uniref:UDP-2,3-diacylglucosamine hydrolase n=1 Tax=Leucothrix pacifica TaxID=1247513 RepID=A0A317C2R0_9GAMM|nr:UDP-2,3-diacylglucosamine diphosphatase [Leucothrix pacifica]PWQ92471.1 UDP-2,3-diacylglucosamine diphosphatase [Leucothrix pacifica]